MRKKKTLPPIESVGIDDMVFVDSSKVIAALTGVYILADIFAGTPDAAVYFSPGVGATGMFAKDEILVSPKLDIESTIFAGL
ncbi:hypothetical protein AKJ39_02755 [candidate division MSBL1 archaeon SCGC-AAA259J03]|uniref:Uncharacterized protein n=1 Tax=candidate division MSBL1 archaeon SCGC-AAA259J03 TaxID=1698269 RepID=A0A656YZ40_9EURY|nr:hypothetical protein AKJ39_02755 [candidate division MSBL1 archaeon SCGC-AAA259J03]